MQQKKHLRKKQLRIDKLNAEWRRHQKDGNLDAAIGVVQQLIELQPNNDGWHAAHGCLLDEANRPDDALQAYQQAQQMNPNDSENNFNVAVALSELGRYQEALAYIESAIKLKPKFALAYLNKAICLRMLGNTQRENTQLALVAIESAIKLEPNNPANYSEKSSIALRLSDFHAALSACNTALKQAKKLRPETLVMTYCNRGTALLSLNQLNEALEDFEQALKLQPSCPAALTMRAQCLQAAQNYPDALTAIDDALKIYPRNPTMNGIRGSILLRSHHYEQALLQLNLAYTQLHLDTALLHCDRAEALLALKRIEEADVAIKQAIALEKNRPSSLVIQEKILRAQGMEPTAEVETLPDTSASKFRNHVLFSPETANLPPPGTPTHALADLDETLRVSRKITGDDESYKEWFSRAMLLNAQRQPEEAIKAFESCLALKPDYGNAHFNRAALLQGERRFDEALTAYQEAARCNPSHAAAHLACGNMLMRSERFADAITAFTRFLDLEPENAEGFARRARAHFESGSYTEARVDCEAALERAGNKPKLQQTCELLLEKISEECPTYCP